MCVYKWVCVQWTNTVECQLDPICVLRNGTSRTLIQNNPAEGAISQKPLRILILVDKLAYLRIASGRLSALSRLYAWHLCYCLDYDMLSWRLWAMHAYYIGLTRVDLGLVTIWIVYCTVLWSILIPGLDSGIFIVTYIFAFTLLYF